MSKLASGQWSCSSILRIQVLNASLWQTLGLWLLYVGGRKSDDERLIMLFAAYLPVRKQIRRCQSHQTINDIDCYSQQADFKMLWTWTLDYIKLNYYTPNCPSYNDSKHIKQINIKSICPIPIPIQKSIHSSQQADFGLSPHLYKHTADYLTMKRWQLTESGRLLWDFAHNAAIEPLVSLFLLVCKRLTPSASMCLFLAFGTTKMIKTIWQIRSLSTGPRLWFCCCRTSDCRSRAPHDSWIAAKLGIWALAWLSIENWFKSLTWRQTFKGNMDQLQIS